MFVLQIINTITDFYATVGAAIATVKDTRWESYRRIGDKTTSLRRVIHRVFRLNLTALTP
jgi:hypothetical protein